MTVLVALEVVGPDSYHTSTSTFCEVSVVKTNIRDRVFSAAELISFECYPTVSMVQSMAGVSSEEAARYLEEWMAEKNAHIAPPALTQQIMPKPGSQDSAGHDSQATRGPEIALLESQNEMLRQQVAKAIATQEDVLQEASQMRARLAAAEARADTWHEAYKHLSDRLERIPPDEQ